LEGIHSIDFGLSVDRRDLDENLVEYLELMQQG
jgi:hypothetical protein